MEEHVKLAVQRLKLLQQSRVVRLLRDQAEQLIHGPEDNPPQFAFGLTDSRRSRSHVNQRQVEILESAFDHARSHRAAATELEDGVLPGQFRILQAHGEQGPELRLPLRLSKPGGFRNAPAYPGG